MLDRYLFSRRTYRYLQDLKSHGLDLYLGSVTEAMRRLVALFEPLYQQFSEDSQAQTFWHAYETRWQVFQSIEGKVGYRWYLEVLHRVDVVFEFASRCAHDVPEAHLGLAEPESILVVDRYSALKAVSQVKDGTITLHFCWAHVRRDFLKVARSDLELGS